MRNANQGLLSVLMIRKLHDKIRLEIKQRNWSKVKDSQSVKHAKGFMEGKNWRGLIRNCMML